MTQFVTKKVYVKYGYYYYEGVLINKEDGIYKVLVGCKLAPRPDGKCYCGTNRKECTRFQKTGKDCTNHTGKELNFMYLTESEWTEPTNYHL